MRHRRIRVRACMRERGGDKSRVATRRVIIVVYCVRRDIVIRRLRFLQPLNRSPARLNCADCQQIGAERRALSRVDGLEEYARIRGGEWIALPRFLARARQTGRVPRSSRRSENERFAKICEETLKEARTQMQFEGFGKVSLRTNGR